MRLLTQIYQGLFDLVYPPLCPSCHKEWVKPDEPICLSCEASLDILFETQSLFAYRFEDQSFKPNHVLLLAHYNTVLKQMVWSFKYGNQPQVARYLGYLMGQCITQSAYKGVFDYIVPVPLHKNKRRRRGYNQARCLASGMAASSAIPLLDNILIRTKNTQTQTRKSLDERKNNVKDAFKYVGPPLEDKHFLLVDDVLTTGSTVNACAEEIASNCSKCDVSYGALALA